MTSTFLRNFKNLIQKRYSLELSNTASLKSELYKLKNEYALPDPGVLHRFPKKELKSFIKIECPIDTQDEHFKAQEVQSSLKRLRALHGVKESLVCQNCSKKATCKVINQVPELPESAAKNGFSDLYTSLLYFAVESDKKQALLEEQKKKEELERTETGQNSKEKADISLEKYRTCQTESSFFKCSVSADKLTDTMHVVLEDLTQNLGTETKKFCNEFNEEVHRRRFMERIFKKLEKEIEQDDALRKNNGKEENDDDEDEEGERRIRNKSAKKQNDFEKSTSKKQDKRPQREKEEIEGNDDIFGSESDFVAVEGKQRQEKKGGILNKIMESDEAEGGEVYNKVIREEREQKREPSYENKRDGYQKRERNQDETESFNQGKPRNNNSKYQRDGERSQRGERSERGDRSERGERSERGDRSERGERSERSSKDSYQGVKKSMDSYKNDRRPSYDNYKGEGNKRDNSQEDRGYGKKSYDRGSDDGVYKKERNNYKGDRKNSYDDRSEGGKRNEWKDKYEKKEDKPRWDSEKRNARNNSNEGDKPWKRDVKEERNQSFGKKVDHNNASDRIQQVDEGKLARFMFTDSGEQKSRIKDEQQAKQYAKEERKANKFTKDIQDIQNIVDKDLNESDQVSEKRKPRFSKGTFKFTKTPKTDDSA